ncbi:MAG: hypothetical protein P8Y10_05310 [Gemmatimonadales bacterium]
MTDSQASLLTVLALAVVHIFAGTTAALHLRWQPRALSAGAGIAVAYVFLELMPALAERQDLVDARGGLLGGDGLARLPAPPPRGG